MSYYILRGFTPEYLLSLSLIDRLFFVAAMRLEEERKAKRLKQIIEFLAKRR